MTYEILVIFLLVYAGFVFVDLFGDGWKMKLRASEPKQYSRVERIALACYGISVILAALVGYIGMFFLWNLAPFLFAYGVICKNIDFSIPAPTGRFRNGIVNLEVFYEGFLITMLFFGPAGQLFERA